MSGHSSNVTRIAVCHDVLSAIVTTTVTTGPMSETVVSNIIHLFLASVLLV